MAERESEKMIRVIVCKPDEYAKVIEIEDGLEAMQALVGGLIEPYDPFYSETDPRYENVILVCNEESKLRQMKPSRAIFDEDGRLLDVIQGPFFLCYSPVYSERFESMPEDLEEEFCRKFELPEQFFQTEMGIQVVRYEPDVREKDLGYERQR